MVKSSVTSRAATCPSDEYLTALESPPEPDTIPVDTEANGSHCRPAGSTRRTVSPRAILGQRGPSVMVTSPSGRVPSPTTNRPSETDIPGKPIPHTASLDARALPGPPTDRVRNSGVAAPSAVTPTCPPCITTVAAPPRRADTGRTRDFPSPSNRGVPKVPPCTWTWSIVAQTSPSPAGMLTHSSSPACSVSSSASATVMAPTVFDPGFLAAKASTSTCSVKASAAAAHRRTRMATSATAGILDRITFSTRTSRGPVAEACPQMSLATYQPCSYG